MRTGLLVIALLASASSGCNLKKFFEDPRCYTSSDCFDGKVCSANLCVGEGSLGTGRRCWATRDCQPGQTCQLVPEQRDGAQVFSQRCLPAGSGSTGATCSSSLDCEAGLRCELVAFAGQCQATGTKDRDAACTGTGECLAGLACAPGGTCLPYDEAYPSFAGVECLPEDGAFRAHFEVPRPGNKLADFFRLPFPSDARVDAGGKLDLGDFPRPGPTPLGIDLVQLYVDALVAEFDGFSAIAPITFRFSGAVDAASLTSAATFVKLSGGGELPLGAELPARTTVRSERTKFSCQDRVIVEHSAHDVLEPRATYAVVLRKVSSAAGVAATQDPDLGAVLGAQRPASEPALARVWDQHAPLRTWLTQKGISPAEIQAATVFTVGDTTGTMEKIRVAIDAAPPPVLSDLTVCQTGVTSPCDDGTDARACGAEDPDFVEIHGRMTMPVFQAGTAPYLHAADGGGIDRKAPSIARTESVCVALSVPRSAAPVDGWPLVVYHHGTGGSFRSFIKDGTAGQLSTGGTRFAALSFDAIVHGARKNGSSFASDQLVFNVINPRAARDNNLQGGADVLTGFRAAALTLPASLTGSAVKFDPRVTYFGHSQGGNAGHLALAVSQGGRAAVLSGAGGGVIDGVLTKTNPINIADGMKLLLGEALDTSHPAMVIFQTFFDPSDPEAYAPQLIRRPLTGVPSKHVLHTFGLTDTYAPPVTLGNITKALGVPLVSPVLASIDTPGFSPWPTTNRPLIANLVGGDGATITAATFQYDPAGLYDGHFVAQRDSQAIVDWKFFLSSFLLAGTPHVP